MNKYYICSTYYIVLYHTKRFKEKEAEIIANKVSFSIGSISELSIGEEVGLAQESSRSPIKASVLTGLSFVLASLIPILHFAFMSLVPAALTAVLAKYCSYDHDTHTEMAGEGGFEPPLYGPEPHVLPLDDSPLKNKI